MTAVDRLYRDIKNGMLNGEFPSGTFLREATLATKYRVSRTPIREAIRRLVSEGWLEAWPNRGARVVEWTTRDVDEVFELRSVLEPLVARRAVHRLSEEDLFALEQLAREMESLVGGDGTDNRERITRLNQQFHGIISEAAASPRIQRVLQGIVLVPVARRSFHNYTEMELQRSMAHHRDLIQAFRSGDGEWAAAVMRGHILAARAAHMRGSCVEQGIVTRRGAPD